LEASVQRVGSRPSRLAAAAYAILIVAALHFAQGLFLPLAMAALLSLLLLPLVKGVERLRVGRIPSILIVVLTAFLVIGAFSWITIRQVSDVGKRLPEYKARVIAKAGSLGPVGRAIKEVQAALAEVGDEVAASTGTGTTRENAAAATKVEVVSSTPKPLEIIGRALFSGIVPLGTSFFVLILVIFILIYHVDLMDRLVHMVGDSRVNCTTQTVTEAVQSVSRYLFLQAAVNAGFGILVALGLWALGLPNALLFGMLAALSRFIPYVGTWVSALLPFLLSVAVSNGWTQPLAILGGWLVAEILIANVLEPWVYGSKTGLSPLAVILSAFFWTWLWGGTGLLLAIPLTVSLVVMGKYLPQFAFLQTLLGSEARLEPKVQLYNRLLALDQQGTVDLVDRFQTEKPPHEVYDGLLLPALCMAESDRQLGRLDEERETTMLENISDLLQDLGERFEEDEKLDTGAPSPAPSSVPRIVCLPASRPADRVAAAMVTQLLHGKAWRMDTVPEHATAGEMVEFIGGLETQVVVISAVPPSSLIQVRYLYKRIRRLHPKVAIVIGLWNDPGDPEILRKRIAPDSDACVVTTLTEAVDQIRQICQSPIPASSRLENSLVPVA
jgi:predicted PurR-regulated permease PerM